MEVVHVLVEHALTIGTTPPEQFDSVPLYVLPPSNAVLVEAFLALRGRPAVFLGSSTVEVSLPALFIPAVWANLCSLRTSYVQTVANG